MRWILSVTLALLTLGGVAEAELIQISGYDIDDAALPPEGSHRERTDTYDGTVTYGDEFHHWWGGTFQKATYRGGTGSLADGITDDLHSDNEGTMRFIAPEASDGTPITPSFTFHLSSSSTIGAIDLFGGVADLNVFGALPDAGSITGATLTLVKPDSTTISDTFSTESWGPPIQPLEWGWPHGPTPGFNDRIDLTGSSLEGVEAVGFRLSDIQLADYMTDDLLLDEHIFRLSEVQAITGAPPIDCDPPVAPEPGSLALLSLGSGLGLVVRRFRGRKTAA